MRCRSAARGLAIAMLIAGIASAQEKAPEKKAKAAPMDEKAAMEAMQKAATPGEAHKKLETMIGTFDAKVKLWMDPSKPAEESAGTSENTWVLGNRFVQTKHEGTFMGQPFSGIGYTGYDNVTKSSATRADPVTGKMTTMTMKTTVTDNDHQTMEMWGPGPDGKNYKMME